MAWVGYDGVFYASYEIFPVLILVYLLMFTCFCVEPCCYFWIELSLRSDNWSTCCFYSDNDGDKRGLDLFKVSFGVLRSYFEGDLREVSYFAYLEEYVDVDSVLLPLIFGITTLFLLELMIVIENLSDYSVEESVSKTFFCFWYNLSDSMRLIFKKKI